MRPRPRARPCAHLQGERHKQPTRQADAAFVVANGGFTYDMRIQATKFGIHLVDRERLCQWAQDRVSLQTMLR